MLQLNHRSSLHKHQKNNLEKKFEHLLWEAMRYDLGESLIKKGKSDY